MMQKQQVGEFYRSLTEEQRRELCMAIAEDIYFLEDALQERVLALLQEAEPEISRRIREINSFTT